MCYPANLLFALDLVYEIRVHMYVYIYEGLCFPLPQFPHQQI